MASTNDKLLQNFPNISWIDVETCGLDESSDALLEVAALVTDRNLNILDPAGFNMVIQYSKEQAAALRSGANSYVQNMHDTTGLWEKLPQGVPMTEVDEKLHEYLSQFSEKGASWLGGNSITLDRNFLRKNLSDSYSHLSHRSIDSTTVGGLASAWFGISYEKKYSHSAFSDITESIEELRFYRDTIFKPIP